MTKRPKTEDFVVAWEMLYHERRFQTFKEAEKFARNLVATGKGKPRDVEIKQGGITVATIDRDALDRVWTDLREPVA